MIEVFAERERASKETGEHARDDVCWFLTLVGYTKLPAYLVYPVVSSWVSSLRQKGTIEKESLKNYLITIYHSHPLTTTLYIYLTQVVNSFTIQKQAPHNYRQYTRQYCLMVLSDDQWPAR